MTKSKYFLSSKNVTSGSGDALLGLMPAQAGISIPFFLLPLLRGCSARCWSCQRAESLHPPVSSHLALHKHLQPLQPPSAPQGNHFSPKQNPCKSQIKSVLQACAPSGEGAHRAHCSHVAVTEARKGKKREWGHRKVPKEEPPAGHQNDHEPGSLLVMAAAAFSSWKPFWIQRHGRMPQRHPGGSRYWDPHWVSRGCPRQGRAGQGIAAPGRAAGWEQGRRQQGTWRGHRAGSQLWRMGLFVREQQIAVRPRGKRKMSWGSAPVAFVHWKLEVLRKQLGCCHPVARGTLQFKLSCHWTSRFLCSHPGPPKFCLLDFFFQGCRQDKGKNSLTFNTIVVFIFEGTVWNSFYVKF